MERFCSTDAGVLYYCNWHWSDIEETIFTRILVIHGSSGKSGYLIHSMMSQMEFTLPQHTEHSLPTQHLNNHQSHL